MKKWLALILALVMCVSLVGCTGEKEPEEEEEPEFVFELANPTPDELLSGGYGVDDLKSVTYNMVFQVERGKETSNIDGFYEQADGVYHMALVEMSPPASREAVVSDTYYDAVAGVEYESDAGVWHAMATDYDDIFYRLSQVPLKELVIDPVMSESDNEYHVLSDTLHEVVNDLMGHVFNREDLLGAKKGTFLTYDRESRLLRNMLFEAQTSALLVVVDIDVFNVNTTEVVVPFDMEDVIYDVSKPDVSVNRYPGEKYISDEFFGVSYLSTETILELYPSLDEVELFAVRQLANNYSKEGFLRMLRNPEMTMYEERVAAVVVCKIMNTKLESLWANDFMSQDEAIKIDTELGGESA